MSGETARDQGLSPERRVLIEELQASALALDATGPGKHAGACIRGASALRRAAEVLGKSDYWHQEAAEE